MNAFIRHFYVLTQCKTFVGQIQNPALYEKEEWLFDDSALSSLTSTSNSELDMV